MQPFGDQGMGQPQHQGHVRIGPRGDPLGIQEVGRVVADRRDADHMGAPGGDLLQPRHRGMGCGAARLHLSIAHGNAAEGDQGVRRLRDRRPGREPTQRRHVADDMGQDGQTGGQGIAVLLPREPAEAVEEALHLGLGVMEPPGTGPAVGPGEDGVVAVGGFHPLQFLGDEVERLVPGHFDKAVAAPRPVAMLQPTFADGRRLDPAIVVQAFGHAIQNGGRIGITGQGPDGDNAVVLGFRFECSPVGAMGLEHGGRGPVCR